MGGLSGPGIHSHHTHCPEGHLHRNGDCATYLHCGNIRACLVCIVTVGRCIPPPSSPAHRS